MAKADPEMRTGFWQDMPELTSDLEWVVEAFWSLSSSRTVSGMGDLGMIPFEAVDRYAARYEVEDFEEFHALIRAMDRAFIEHRNSR